jgi:TonB family protein
MGAPKNPRMLGVALALSLLFHLVIAPFVHAPVEAVPHQDIHVITHITVRPTPEPTPKPRPHVTLSQRKLPNVSPRITRPHVPPNPTGHVAITPPEPTGVPNAPGNTGPNGPGGVIGQPVAPPTEAPGPACSDPNVEAKTVVAVAPERTTDDFTAGTSTTAMIKVNLDASGRVTGVSVYASTGSLELDQAAMRAARESTYSPEMRDCQAVAGSYLFKVEFSN